MELLKRSGNKVPGNEISMTYFHGVYNEDASSIPFDNSFAESPILGRASSRDAMRTSVY